ncbi:capsular polysaccharide export protein, LipB/KpsS family [Chromobacterium phragmitis]|uniref:Capsule biosynthesis protein n=2 Tax=Chromobacterium phragmitis TaxID=2202141 RepID=A0ABV0IYT3_9NEIS
MMILFSDNHNFKKQNFPALFKTLDNNSILYEFDQSNTELKSSWGRYSTSNNQEHSIHDYSDLINEQSFGIHLYPIYKFELLFICASDEEWIALGEHCEKATIRFFMTKYPEKLNQLRFISKFWLEHWRDCFSTKKPTIGISFGGNTIYTRAFCEIAKINQIPSFITEHFFTGTDFYFEKRYESITNNSLLKSKSYTKRKLAQQANHIHSIQKLSLAKNKNVIQPSYQSFHKKDYCLVIAQVSNDFAILSDRNKYKNSIQFYIDFINKFLTSTKRNIVIKTHPYEKRKNSEGRAITFEILHNFIGNLPQEQQERISLVEDYSIHGLIDNCKYAITLNSQSAFDVVARGKPIACFGNPFYGHHGFTYDFDTIDAFFKEQPIALTTDQLTLFWEYMSVCFSHLIGESDSIKIQTLLDIHKIPKNKTSHNQISRANSKEPSIASDKNQITRNKPSANISPYGAVSKRKLRKLIKNPKAFFLDSKSNLLNKIGQLIK